ncbi:cold-inducible protein YdjO-related protein [Paenibacillus chartarius]|uniref:Cold-inducible protein YdjO-related protein n=1 Tax=Paenibacillus chartarius TaxID=747481 RepID=A0ABV6DV03_9BACL
MMTEMPNKPELAPVPIWRCRRQDCKAWVREELASSSQPSCPICKGEMIRSMKHLPKLVKKHKAQKKKAPSDPWENV